MDFGDYIAEAEEQARLKSHALIKKYGQMLLKHFGLQSASAPNAKLTVTSCSINDNNDILMFDR